jgi:hypothetical protein
MYDNLENFIIWKIQILDEKRAKNKKWLQNTQE